MVWKYAKEQVFRSKCFTLNYDCHEVRRFSSEIYRYFDKIDEILQQRNEPICITSLTEQK